MNPEFIVITVLLIALNAGWWAWRDRRMRKALAAATHQNETLRKREQQLLADRGRQETIIFDSMAEGVLLLDRDRRIRLNNRALVSLFRVNQDIRGLTVLEAFRLHQLDELVNRALQEKEVLNYEFELPGLSAVALEVNATTLSDPAGRQQGMILVFHDLTRIKQLENARKEFVANVSHELRTPLSMIKGYVETLINGAKDEQELAGRFLTTIEKHADRLTFLIEDLLTLSRLESGNIAMNAQPTRLHRLVEETLDDLNSRAELKSVTLHNQVSATLRIQVDANRIQQVLFNLVDNAINYGKKSGQVWIEANELDTEMVRINVRDDGPGIPAESLGRVFERFYRADKARSREQGGTGLGLAIVKHIVQLHGGEVGVDSKLGMGTTFTFTLRPQTLPTVDPGKSAP